ncbi:MAG TPA: response regulator [Gemmataceae bacterium]|nr:response regulator [Gemmataceae bacterium]
MTRADADRPADAQANILLVDDRPANLLALEGILAVLGQNLVEAHSGEEALRLLRDDEFAVVLLDVHMCGLDGFETARRIRAGDRSRHTPIIFLTAYESADFPVVQAYQLGAVDYLLKPLEPEILRAKVAGFVELFHARRLAEAAMHAQREQERAALLVREQEARAQAEAASLAKDQFLAMLAHELRNPLAPILNALHIMRVAGSKAPAVEQAKGIIDRQVRHMARLVNDLLDVSRIARGRNLLRTQRLDLTRLVLEAGEDYRSALEKAGQELVLDLPPEALWVEGDATRLSQVVGNLLHNAAKFTDPARPGGRATLRLAADRAACRAVISVADQGLGIDADLLPHVFETFTQADHSLDRKPGGLGLGLALVKGLVELHGGGVEAASGGVGAGATFTLWLPLAEELTPQQEAPAPAGTAAGCMRILVIEDNADTAATLRLLLQMNGHEVTVAHSGAAGVETARQFRPRVVLCDLGLPGGMDGFAVARALRHDPRTAGVRLICITGYGQDADRRHAREAGFDLHLTKPVDPADLDQVLARMAAGA